MFLNVWIINEIVTSHLEVECVFDVHNTLSVHLAHEHIIDASHTL